jgi:hypothetical protein
MNSKNKIIGLISTIDNYIDNNEKICDSNGDIKKMLGISFIQFILLDKKYISSKLYDNEYIINEFKKKYELNNEDLSMDYIGYITDYNENNIISKYTFSKGFVHTYNFSFNYMNKNLENVNLLDHGFMMLHP